MPTLLLQGKSCESTQLPYGAASGKLSLESSINLDWHSLCRCAGRQGRGQESVQAGRHIWVSSRRCDSTAGPTRDVSTHDPEWDAMSGRAGRGLYQLWHFWQFGVVRGEVK